MKLVTWLIVTLRLLRTKSGPPWPAIDFFFPIIVGSINSSVRFMKRQAVIRFGQFSSCPPSLLGSFNYLQNIRPGICFEICYSVQAHRKVGQNVFSK